VAWALLNLVIGFVLYKVGGVSGENYATLGVFFLGILAISTMLSFRFAEKMQQ
jgi:hypothetical protein